MKAFILAGGLGTRLRPLTYVTPKPLLPVANRPHLEHVFDLLARHGVVEIVLLTSYLSDEFEDAVARARRRGLDAVVVREKEPLDTAGALKNAEHLLDDEPFLVCNGDVLTSMDLTNLRAFHSDRAAVGTIALTPVEDPSLYGVVSTDGEGKVVNFIEKPPRDESPSNLINAGVYVLERGVLEHVTAGRKWSAERALFPELVEGDSGLYACATDAYWIDIGTREKYLQANVDALGGRFPTDAVAHPGEGASLIDERAEIAAGARISSACVGPWARVAEGAVVEASVLLPRASVGERATVRAAIVGGDARVAPGTVVEGTIVGRAEEG